jgi:hypothetical protein
MSKYEDWRELSDFTKQLRRNFNVNVVSNRYPAVSGVDAIDEQIRKILASKKQKAEYYKLKEAKQMRETKTIITQVLDHEGGRYSYQVKYGYHKDFHSGESTRVFDSYLQAAAFVRTLFLEVAGAERNLVWINGIGYPEHVQKLRHRNTCKVVPGVRLENGHRMLAAGCNWVAYDSSSRNDGQIIYYTVKAWEEIG